MNLFNFFSPSKKKYRAAFLQPILSAIYICTLHIIYTSFLKPSNLKRVYQTIYLRIISQMKKNKKINYYKVQTPPVYTNSPFGGAIFVAGAFSLIKLGTYNG